MELDPDAAIEDPSDIMARVIAAAEGKDVSPGLAVCNWLPVFIYFCAAVIVAFCMPLMAPATPSPFTISHPWPAPPSL